MQDSLLVAVVAETALRRDAVSRAQPLHLSLHHLRGQYGSRSIKREEKHVRLLFLGKGVMAVER